MSEIDIGEILSKVGKYLLPFGIGMFIGSEGSHAGPGFNIFLSIFDMLMPFLIIIMVMKMIENAFRGL